MERKRARLRIESDDEEEEEEEKEDKNRRPSLRIRKKPKYTEDDEDEEEDRDEVEEEGEEDDEQPGPSTQNNHTQERFLNVTCGNKTGLLDKDKLYQAVKCIKCGDSWFSPSAFEELGGKGANKKWKTSILYDKKPLKFWIEQGHLTTQGFQKTTKKMKIRSSSRISESTSEGREAKSIISTPLREVKVVIRRLPEFQVQTNAVMEYPLKDSEDAQNEDERARNGSPVDDLSITASVQLDHSHMLETSTIGGDEKENQEGFTEDSEREEDEQRKIKTESSPTLSARATMSQDIKPETKHIGSLGDHAANLCASPVLVVTVTDTHLVDIKGDWEEGHCEEVEEKEGTQTEMGPALFEDCENASDEHLHMSRSDATGQPFATGSIRDAASPQTFIKEEISAAMDYDPPTTSPSLLVGCKYEMTDGTTSSHDTAELQAMLLETGVPQISQASDTTPFPDIVEAQSSGSSTSSDLDTMDLDQLRKEKIKMQIRVLRLQEKYYTQKIKEQNK
ncbi:transcriptional regulator ATRX homolog isoform X2 [Larimichthys crocea]|uniref:transcriptional regulator ATRX homolog isoform X2 n=1 Tax=Larimichthys crocea TaxID=215358 RepID=UPI000F5EA8DF|nr:transcriptional regulator ATRX homolog isoform X2 [Larimichthys crocea]